MNDYIDPRLAQRGARIIRAQPSDDRQYWRLVRAEWMDVEQSRGLRHILVDVLDANGNRALGVPVLFGWPDGAKISSTTEKRGESYAVDFPMDSAGNPYFCEIHSGLSDRVEGMGMGSIEQPYYAIHTSYRLVFRCTTAGNGNGDPPEQPPGNQELVREMRRLLHMARADINKLEDLLDKLS